MAVKLSQNFTDYGIDYSSFQFEEEKKFIFFLSAAKEFRINPGCPQMFVTHNNGIEFVLDPISTDSLALLVDILVSLSGKDIKEGEVVLNALVGLCKLAKLHPQYKKAHALYTLKQAILELVRSGFELNQIYSNGASPLHIAAHHNLDELISALGACGALIDIKSPKGFTPLHVACSWNHSNAVQALLFLGADPNAQASKHITPLLAGAESAKIIKMLAKKGADLNFERPVSHPKIPFESCWKGAKTAVESSVRKESYAALKMFCELHARISPQTYAHLKGLIISKIQQKITDFRSTDASLMLFLPRIINLVNMLDLLNQSEEGSLKNKKIEFFPELLIFVDKKKEKYVLDSIEKLNVITSEMPYTKGWKKTAEKLQDTVRYCINVIISC